MQDLTICFLEASNFKTSAGLALDVLVLLSVETIFPTSRNSCLDLRIYIEDAPQCGAEVFGP